MFQIKGSLGTAFTILIRTVSQIKASFSPFDQHEISVLIELTLRHLRYFLTDVPPQPNSQNDDLLHTDIPRNEVSLMIPPNVDELSTL